LKNASPVEHDAGSEAPVFIGFVVAAPDASQFPRMLRLPLIVIDCADKAAAPTNNKVVILRIIPQKLRTISA
jgi:hypothetical protein